MVARELAVKGTYALGYGSVRQYHSGQRQGPQLSTIGMAALFAKSQVPFICIPGLLMPQVPLHPAHPLCSLTLALGHKEGGSPGSKEECFKTL